MSPDALKDYSRKGFMGVAVGGKPETATASYFFIGKKYEPGWIRTIDTRLKRAMLYQLSYGPIQSDHSYRP